VIGGLLGLYIIIPHIEQVVKYRTEFSETFQNVTAIFRLKLFLISSVHCVKRSFSNFLRRTTFLIRHSLQTELNNMSAPACYFCDKFADSLSKDQKRMDKTVIRVAISCWHATRRFISSQTGGFYVTVTFTNTGAPFHTLQSDLMSTLA